jgi:hypothetical protein
MKCLFKIQKSFCLTVIFRVNNNIIERPSRLFRIKTNIKVSKGARQTAYGDRLRMETDCVWRQTAYGGRLRMETDCVWRQTAYGDRLRMETDCIWRQTAYGDRLRMETDCVWRQTAYGDRLHMETDCIRKAEHARSLQYKYHTKAGCGMSHNTVRQHDIQAGDWCRGGNLPPHYDTVPTALLVTQFRTRSSRELNGFLYGIAETVNWRSVCVCVCVCVYIYI